MSRSRKNRNKEESEGGIAEWMLTYSDMVTLLLTFFIMLFSMATIDKQKFVEIANSLRSSFLKLSNGEQFNVNKGEDIFSITTQNSAIDNQDEKENNDPSKQNQFDQQLEAAAAALNAQKLEDVKAKIEAAIEKHNLTEFVKVIEEKRSLILRFNSVLLFDLGSADIKESGKDILKELGGMLKELDNEITIEGHTDDIPINTLLFPSNWELSTKRATNVVVFLIDNCGLDPTKLTAAGRGEFKPIAPNDTVENRQKNRRIDIVIDKYGDSIT